MHSLFREGDRYPGKGAVLMKDYRNYTPDFRTKIVPMILERANYRCEECGVGHHAKGCRDRSEIWRHERNIHKMSLSERLHLFGKISPQIMMIVICVAHLDQNTHNNDPKNLKALCQQCHNRHDAPYRGKNAHAARRRNLER